MSTAAADSTNSRRAIRPGAILALVCGAQFMVILDIAIVNVAIPSIQADLGVQQSDLQWVVVTYGVTLGGFLLLGGRAADLLGRRNVLVAGLSIFAAASLGAGLANSLSHLVAARALQGLGAALAAPAALSILTSTFAEGPSRTKALGIFGAVASSAASVGVIASGVLTDGPGWEWIFLVNVPIGMALIGLILAFIPQTAPVQRGSADVAGAVSVTAGLLAIVYAINKSVDYGWTSQQTLGFGLAGAALLIVFIVVEQRATAPLVPLSMFRRPTLRAANLGAALVFGAFFATIFRTTLFMQQVLSYTPIETGIAWLGNTAFSLVAAAAVAPRLINRFGPGTSLILGQALFVAGLLHLSLASADAAYWTNLFPGFVALGVGLGLSILATQVAAFIGVEEAVAGLAGGILETSREIGGAMGVAVVATVAIARADDVLAAIGPEPGAATTALAEGFQRGSLVAAAISAAGALVAGVALRRAERATTASPSPDLMPPVPGDVLREPIAGLEEA